MNCPKCLSTLPDDSEFCPFCGEKIINAVADKEIIKQAKQRIRESRIKEFKGKSKVFVYAAIVEAVAIITLGICSFITVYTLKETVHDRDIAIKDLNDKLNDSRDELNKSRDENDDLRAERVIYNSYKEKAEVLDKYIAFYNKNDNYYHKYDCSLLDDNCYYNIIDNAEYDGYKPCPHCH